MHSRRMCAVTKSALLSSARWESSSLRQRPWEGDILKCCAERKQVRVSLESVVDVSTGNRPWRASFGENNPGVELAQEELDGSTKHACKSYLPGATRRGATTEGQLQSAQYLHRELPVRLAYAITALNEMEDTGLTDIEHVTRVHQKYLHSFMELQETERPQDKDSIKAFTAIVKRVQNRGSDTARLMARGLQELTRRCDHGDCDWNQTRHDGCGGGGGGGGCEELDRVQDFMDKFYQNRVAMRFLCGHYLALSSPPRKGFIGLVQQGVSLTNIAQGAAMEAASICSHALGACPEIRMRVDRSGDGLVAAVPEYVHYVVLELLKNAMMATMKMHGRGGDPRTTTKMAAVDAERGHHGDGNGEDAPIVFADVPEVVISVKADGDDDIFLVVSDQGEGIPEEDSRKVWSFLYTTASESVRKAYLTNGGNSPSKPPPLAGLGCGLPLSRIYARCFGGELQLQSETGRGTHATLRLSRHGSKLEPLVWPKPANDAGESSAYRMKF